MGVVKNEINISKLMVSMAGIEANTAGLMTSVAAIEATTAGLMTSVISAKGSIDNLKRDLYLDPGDTITENSNPIYTAALFQDNKHVRFTLPLVRRITASSVSMTISNLQLFRAGAYEEHTSGITISANVINETGLYVIIESETAFTTFSSLDPVMIRIIGYTISAS